jgi:hypothetical protein
VKRRRCIVSTGGDSPARALPFHPDRIRYRGAGFQIGFRISLFACKLRELIARRTGSLFLDWKNLRAWEHAEPSPGEHLAGSPFFSLSGPKISPLQGFGRRKDEGNSSPQVLFGTCAIHFHQREGDGLDSFAKAQKVLPGD